MRCNRCDGEGLLNIPEPESMDSAAAALLRAGDLHGLLAWLEENAPDRGDELQVCDCCGDGEGAWHGTPGEHYTEEDPRGPDGPYAYNGGLAECH